MQSPERHQRLAALRDVIADIERKPALAEVQSRVELDGDVFPRLPAGLVQEIFSDETRDAGASLAFSLAQAKSLLTPRRPAVFYVQMIEDAQALGVPYGPGLDWFGLDPSNLLVVRTANMTEFLWAAEEIISCRAVAGMVADIRGSPRLLDFTASRRLSMRASSHKVSLFMLRYGARQTSSASHLRWRLAPQRSGRNPYDDRAPGAARWRLRLEKGRIAGRRTEWLLEWNRDGLSVFAAPTAHASRSRAPLPGAVPALLGDRLSQAG